MRPFAPNMKTSIVSRATSLSAPTPKGAMVVAMNDKIVEEIYS
jgi:hypothetical protein